MPETRVEVRLFSSEFAWRAWIPAGSYIRTGRWNRPNVCVQTLSPLNVFHLVLEAHARTAFKSVKSTEDVVAVWKDHQRSTCTTPPFCLSPGIAGNPSQAAGIQQYRTISLSLWMLRVRRCRLHSSSI